VPHAGHGRASYRPGRTPASLVRRVLAPNPSAFTFTGHAKLHRRCGEVAVIDPGPDEHDHIAALIAATQGERVAAIICTHTHRDHSPASRALAAATGAPIVGCAPLAITDDGPRADASFDFDYAPDRILADGERVEGAGWTLEAVATPGHTSNHLCFALAGTGILFTGDHVMAWSTTIVSPPDGDMGAYMASLDRCSRATTAFTSRRTVRRSTTRTPMSDA
jgi:glyoxylase-like metal-dependent hydrolase (beta-lactamase superfamily II)